MLKPVLVSIAALVFATAAHATTIIDFEDVPTGEYGEIASGSTFGGVTFFDTIGDDLGITRGDHFDDFNNRSLRIGSDDASALMMNFAQISTNLSLAFGNDDDDECCSAPGDLALLRLFLGGSQVAETVVALNLNEDIDQTISILGVAFDSAVFGYVRPDLTPNTNMESIDDISYDVVAAVPEPATWAMMISGFGMIGGTMRRLRPQGLSLA